MSRGSYSQGSLAAKQLQAFIDWGTCSYPAKRGIGTSESPVNKLLKDDKLANYPIGHQIMVEEGRTLPMPTIDDGVLTDE